MYKALLIILLGFTCFSFLDGLDTFTVYLNHKQVGQNDETNYGRTFFINANLDKDTLMFRYMTDDNSEMDSKIELREMDDSVIHFAVGSYRNNFDGTFIFTLPWIKNTIQGHKEMKIFVILKRPFYPDTAEYTQKEFIGYLKFN